MLRGITPEQAALILSRIPRLDPKHLAAFFARIKTAPCPVDLPGPCWLWTGDFYGHNERYPRFYIKRRGYRAHRWGFQAFVRKLRVDEDCHHECEVPKCVNPWHMTAIISEKHSRRGPPVDWDGELYRAVHGVPEDEPPF